jgi:hypothetical protein
MLARFLCGVAFAALSVGAASADELPTVLITTDKSKVTLVFDRALPNVPGKSMKGVLVEYQPGGSNPAHTHPDSAFIYATVLEGEFVAKSMTVRNRCIAPARAGPRYLAIITSSAQMTVTLNPHACWPCSSSIPTKRTWS